MDVYLDYQSAKPVDESVLKTMLPYFKQEFGNPSSLHKTGDKATTTLEDARKKVANFINAPNPEDIIFTSGATESNNLALIGGAMRYKRNGNHIITSEIEHISIRNIVKYLQREGFEIDKVPVDQFGKINLEKFKRMIRDETILISIAIASNEIGTIQPIREISKIAQENEILFHTDAIASESSLPIDVHEVPFDMVSLSSNDIYGPKGIGALYLKKGIRVNPVIIGGGQEKGIRSGSYNLHGIVGFGKAAEIMKKEMPSETERLKKYRDKLIENVLETIPNSYLNGHPSERLAHNAHFRFDYIEGESLILDLKEVNIAAATGSACSSKTLEPSHTLISCGLLHEEAHGSLLFTLGRYTKESDIDAVIVKLPKIIRRLRMMSPLTPPDLIKKYNEVKE
ncbi:MAG: aminotransferase class V-fold PLP-dependent enzyme [Candidatus Lokiarchaeota archaeon]|nr:aminotransferase class V-fold PLP-dependent enzyme [Candidatus Lokiarchaeota archaeon]MBD3200332.1 aminotransferase class V-fold PLP-dependent enzyme [Candidatus Lokiarchaeota archaeon]